MAALVWVSPRGPFAARKAAPVEGCGLSVVIYPLGEDWRESRAVPVGCWGWGAAICISWGSLGRGCSVGLTLGSRTWPGAEGTAGDRAVGTGVAGTGSELTSALPACCLGTVGRAVPGPTEFPVAQQALVFTGLPWLLAVVPTLVAGGAILRSP
uniref:Uncharacterized protein n=1 Tax=Junco hyemalis TaxID=40217 RepID=A0A8C5IE99_JUNHY